MNGRAVLILLLLLISGGITSSYAQRVLVLDKRGKVKRLHYRMGDKIKVTMKDNVTISGMIEGMTDDEIIVQGDYVPVADIAVVHRTIPALRFLGGLMMTAGAFYIGVQTVNSVVAGDEFADDRIWIPAGISIGVGGILFLLSKKKHKVYGTGDLRIINPTPIPIVE
jgi:predicted phage tail protein